VKRDSVYACVYVYVNRLTAFGMGWSNNG